MSPHGLKPSPSPVASASAGWCAIRCGTDWASRSRTSVRRALRISYARFGYMRWTLNAPRAYQWRACRPQLRLRVPLQRRACRSLSCRVRTSARTSAAIFRRRHHRGSDNGAVAAREYVSHLAEFRVSPTATNPSIRDRSAASWGSAMCSKEVLGDRPIGCASIPS